MHIARKIVACAIVVLVALAVASRLVAQVSGELAQPRTPAQYFIAATAQVTLSLPASPGGGQNMYRQAGGRWAPLPDAHEAGGVLTFTLSPAQLDAGRTVVLLGKPDWLVAEDNEPPKVTKVQVDGREVAPTAEINLGWLDIAPQTFEISVADTQNPLDVKSVCALVGGRTIRAGSPGLEFLPDPQDNKKGRIVCSLAKIGTAEASGTQQITIHCDDFAPDTTDCTITLSYTVTRLPEIELGKPAATTPDGVKVFVDSALPGYENVECILDGKLQTPGTTTYGGTWASAETPLAHWFCLALPKPREVSGIEISWANYQGTFWASDRYAILTWDGSPRSNNPAASQPAQGAELERGSQWLNALRVSNNPEAQTSVHSFAPRTTDRVLVWVPPGGNHPGRPDLMWVTEVKLLP